MSPTPASADPAFQNVKAQLTQMQEDIRKRDSLIQDLYKQFQSPQSQKRQEANLAQQLADARKEIEQLKQSTSQLRQSQQDLSIALNSPERGAPPSVTTRHVRERIGKWQEFLETPISVSQRRTRPTPTTRHSR